TQKLTSPEKQWLRVSTTTTTTQRSEKSRSVAKNWRAKRGKCTRFSTTTISITRRALRFACAKRSAKSSKRRRRHWSYSRLQEQIQHSAPNIQRGIQAQHCSPH